MPAKSKSQQRLFGIAYAFKKGEIPEDEVSQEVKDMADSMSLKKLKDYASTKHDDLPDKVKDESVDEASAIYQGPIKKYRNKMATDFKKEYNGNYTLHFGNKKILEVPPSDIRLVESSKSGVFKNKTKFFPFQAAILAHNWKKKGYFTILEEDENEVELWGYRKKGQKEADWKYISDDYILMHDLKSRELFDLTTEPKGEKIKSIFEAANATLGNTPGMGAPTFPGDYEGQNDFVNQEVGSGDIPGGDLPGDDEDEEEKDHLFFSRIPAKPVSVYKSFEQFVSEGVKTEKLPVKVTIEKNWTGRYTIKVPIGKMTWDTWDHIFSSDNDFKGGSYDYKTGEGEFTGFESEKEAKSMIKKFKKFIKL